MRLKTKYPVLLTWFWFGKIYGFVRVYDGTSYLVLLRMKNMIPFTTGLDIW